MSAMEITNSNFESEVVNSDRPVLLDFWATWCGHCRAVAPVVDEIAEENSQIRVGKINIDNEPELAKRFKIMSIPTLMVVEKGKVVRKVTGAHPKGQILDLLRN